jgi:DNA topoisomerase VI subunit A
MDVKKMPDDKSKEKLENFGKKVAENIFSGAEPEFELPIRSLSNIYFDKTSKTIKMGDKKSKRSFLNISHARKFMQTTAIAAELKKIIKEKATISIRDLYYALKHPIKGTKENLFEDQSESDPLIEDIESSLGLLREELNLSASTKGVIAGKMVVKDGRDTINLGKMGSGGWGVPSNVEPEKLEIKDIDAEYVLVIEKDAVWKRFNEDRFWQKHKCIILTGKGQAARGERRLVQRLNKEYNLPVYCLMDADPWGFYIYSVFKQGSISLSYSESKLATPDTKFIGLTISDIDKFKIPKEVPMRLNAQDIKRIKEIRNYPWFKHKKWQDELKLMKDKNSKMEIEALSRKRIRFVTEEYVPQKMETNDFLP